MVIPRVSKAHCGYTSFTNMLSRFYHLPGTKRNEKDQAPSLSINLNSRTETGKKSVNATQNQAPIQNQVFQIAQQPWEVAIEKMAAQMEQQQ